MILYRRSKKLYDQEELAIKFGVKIGEKYKNAFGESLDFITSHNYDEGINTLDSIEQIQWFLTQEWYDLHIEKLQFDDIDQLENFLIKNINDSHDIWCEYIMWNIYDYSYSSPIYIHDGLIESYNTETKIITIIDPEPEHRNRSTIWISEFFDRISGKYGRKTGFLMIS